MSLNKLMITALLFIVNQFRSTSTARAIKEAAALRCLCLVLFSIKAPLRIRNILSALRVTLKNGRNCVAPRVVINCGCAKHNISQTDTPLSVCVCVGSISSALVISTAPESMQRNNKFGYTSHAQQQQLY